MFIGWFASTTLVICNSGYTWRDAREFCVLLSFCPLVLLWHIHPLSYLLAVLQDAFLGADTALGARGVRLPLAILHVDVHVELPTEHCHLGLS